MSKSLTVCSEWRPGLNSGNFKTVDCQGLVAGAAALLPCLCNSEHCWTNFQRWLCFLAYLIRNTWIWVGEVLSAHRCCRIQYGMCLEHVNCYLIISIPKALLTDSACWTLKISWSFLPSVGFPCLQIKVMTFYLGSLLDGILQCLWSCEVLECSVPGRAWTWTWNMKYAGGWNGVVCNKGGKTLGHVLNTRDETICWTSFTLHCYRASFCGGGKIFAHKIN